MSLEQNIQINSFSKSLALDSQLMSQRGSGQYQNTHIVPHYSNIFFVGNTETGKSSIIRKLLGKEINKMHHETSKTQFQKKKLKDDHQLYLVDTPGKQKYQQQQAAKFLECANIIVLVYDNIFVENIQANLIERWVPNIESMIKKYQKEPSKLHIIACCNKSDVEIKLYQQKRKKEFMQKLMNKIQEMGCKYKHFQISCQGQNEQFKQFQQYLQSQAKKEIFYSRNSIIRSSAQHQNQHQKYNKNINPQNQNISQQKPQMINQIEEQKCQNQSSKKQTKNAQNDYKKPQSQMKRQPSNASKQVKVTQKQQGCCWGLC